MSHNNNCTYLFSQISQGFRLIGQDDGGDLVEVALQLVVQRTSLHLDQLANLKNEREFILLNQIRKLDRFTKLKFSKMKENLIF
jgi:hypothetical protein